MPSNAYTSITARTAAIACGLLLLGAGVARAQDVRIGNVALAPGLAGGQDVARYPRFVLAK